MKNRNLVGQGFHTNPERINRKGRPAMPDINKAIAKVLKGDEDGLTALEAILKALIKKAIKGDVKAAQLLLDRAYGKARQSFDVTHEPLTKITGITFDSEP